jgi:hypothetical protein
MPTTGDTIVRPRSWRRSPARPARPQQRKPGRRATRRQDVGAQPAVRYYDLAAILFVGAVCGIYFGLTCGWQIAVESAQAVAGVVEYPRGNPFYIYHVKSWTLLHQIPALLLKCGVSESALSMAIACTAAAIFQQALGLTCYAFCRDRLVACAVPLVYLATNVCKGRGAVYPLFIVPDEYWTSYGVTGSAWAMLAWSLWGVGLRRSAALLTGLAPAIHPALGGWCVLLTAIAFFCGVLKNKMGRRSPRRAGRVSVPVVSSLQSHVEPGRVTRSITLPGGLRLPLASDRRYRFCFSIPISHSRVWQRLKTLCQNLIVRWFIVGLSIAAASYLLQQYIARGLPPADPVLSRKLLEAFVEGWDNHRVPFPLGSVDCQFGWCLLMLTAVVHAWFVNLLPRDSRLLLRILLLSALGSLALCLLTHIGHWLPLEVMMAMPGRFINLAILGYPAALVGLLARGRRVWLIDGLLCGLSVFCLLRTLMLSKRLIYVPEAYKIFIATGLLLVYVLASHEGAEGSARVRRLARHGAVACLALAGYLWMRDLHLAILLWLSVPALWTSQNWLGRLDYGRVRQAAIVLKLRCRVARSVSDENHGIPSLTLGATRLVTVACLWLAFMVKGGWLLGAGCLIVSHSHILHFAFCILHYGSRGGLSNAKCKTQNAKRKMGAILPEILIPAAISIAMVSVPLVERARAGRELFREAERDPVITAARRESGMLLVVPRMCLVQLRTRRPVLLNGEAMNQITYVPQSGPAMNEIVKGIYGDDILKPRPAWWQNWGGLMAHSGYELWQAREPAEWRRLSREFGFTQIVTGREWKLRLPVLARSETLILYGASEERWKAREF